MEGQAVKHVAVVGCGISGLASIKSCLEEGIEPHCFEMNSDIGGLWYSPTTPKPGGGPQMYDSLITNTSKSMTCFSDFPFPPHYPPYLPHALFFKYLQSYADHFDLRKHIQFNTKVVSIAKADDYVSSGRWVVTTVACPPDGSSTETERGTSREFDGVILCQGFFRLPYTPSVPGLGSEFKGKVHHSISYKNSAPFKGRTVVVVGSLSSAGDIAVDLAPVARQVYLSVRHGAYNLSRLSNGREPLDFALTRLTQYYVPSSLRMRILAAHATRCLDPVASGLQPEPSRDPELVDLLINDLLPFKVMTGQVKVVSHIDKLSGHDVHLTDASVLSQVDDIIFATGYKSDFSLIDPALFISDPDDSGRLEVYKMIFPLALPHPTLALVAFARIMGPVAPVLELQARLAACVMAGTHKLPDHSVMKKDVDCINRQQLKTFGTYKYTFNSLLIADMVAAELGVRPDFWRLLLRGDLKMALATLLGPAYPFHFRLLGPHPWDGARDATLNAYKETVYSVQHRRVKPAESKSLVCRILVLMGIPGLLLAFLVWLWQGN